MFLTCCTSYPLSFSSLQTWSLLRTSGSSLRTSNHGCFHLKSVNIRYRQISQLKNTKLKVWKILSPPNFVNLLNAIAILPPQDKVIISCSISFVSTYSTTVILTLYPKRSALSVSRSCVWILLCCLQTPDMSEEIILNYM